MSSSSALSINTKKTTVESDALPEKYSPTSPSQYISTIASRRLRCEASPSSPFSSIILRSPASPSLGGIPEGSPCSIFPGKKAKAAYTTFPLMDDCDFSQSIKTIHGKAKIILGLSGGGTRGIITATILDRLFKELDAHPSEVDMLAGTSAGSIIAAALSVPKKGTKTPAFTTEKVIRLFEERAEDFFVQNKYFHFFPAPGLLKPKYNSTQLSKLLGEFLKDTRMDQLLTGFFCHKFQCDHRS